MLNDWAAGKGGALPGGNMLARGAAGFAAEAASEAPQGAGEQLGQNLGEVAAGTRSVDALGQGLAGSAVLEGLAGGVPGAALGLAQGPKRALASTDPGMPTDGPAILRALPAPGPITVDAAGGAETPAQAFAMPLMMAFAGASP